MLQNQRHLETSISVLTLLLSRPTALWSSSDWGLVAHTWKTERWIKAWATLRHWWNLQITALFHFLKHRSVLWDSWQEKNWFCVSDSVKASIYNFTFSPRNPSTLQLHLNPKALHSGFLLYLTIWFLYIHYFCQLQSRNSNGKNQPLSHTLGPREASEPQPEPAWGQEEATGAAGHRALPEDSDKEKDHFLRCERLASVESSPVFPLALWGGGGCLEGTSGCMSALPTPDSQAPPFPLLPLVKGQGQVRIPNPPLISFQWLIFLICPVNIISICFPGVYMRIFV